MPSPAEDTPPPGEDSPLAIKGTTAATIQAALISAFLAIATVVGAVGTVLSYWKARDLAGWIFWLRSSDALMAITALTTLLGFVAIIVRSVRRKWREVFLARHTPNNIAYIVGEQFPSSPDSRARNGNGAPSTRLVSIEQLREERDRLEKDDMEMFPIDPDEAQKAELQKAIDKLPHTDGAPVQSLVPHIPGDALSVPVIDLRKPPPPADED